MSLKKVAALRQSTQNQQDEERTAIEIRAVYYTCLNAHNSTRGRNTFLGNQAIPRWDGGVDPKTGYKYAESIWKKIARLVIQNRCNPGDFVRSQFSDRTDPPTPNMLLSETAFSRYEHKVTHNVDLTRLRISVNTQICNVLSEITLVSSFHPPDAAVRMALLNPLLQASALIRYCFAERKGIKDAMDHYREDARKQYSGYQDAYNDVLGEMRPRTLWSEDEASTSDGDHEFDQPVRSERAAIYVD